MFITIPEGVLIVYLKKHSSEVLPVVWRTLLSELTNLNSARLLWALEHSTLTECRSFPFEAAKSISHIQDMPV